jgi:hypothetical protein
MITCKASVRFAILRVYIWSILERLNTIFQKYGYPVVITCGTEAHGPDDPHTHGFAIDIRSKHIHSQSVKHDIRDELQQALGDIYTVILESEGLENEHIHIQVRKGLWKTLI